MAAGTSLVITYETSSGSTTQHTWKYAKPSPTLPNVKSLITATITNGAIFGNVPVAVKKAKTVTTTETEFDLESVMMADGKDSRSMISVSTDTDETPEVSMTEEIPYESKAARVARLEAELAKLR